MATAKARIKNLRGVKQAVTQLFNSAIQRESFLMRIRDFSVVRIQAETRKGRDLSNDGKPIKPVQPGWTSFKRQIERGNFSVKPQKSEFLTSQRSNLSITGQLIDSLRGKPLVRQGAIEVFPTGRRKETTFKSSKRGAKPFSLGDQIDTNEALAASLKKRGWTFLGMDKKGVQRIRRVVLDEFRRRLRLKA